MPLNLFGVARMGLAAACKAPGIGTAIDDDQLLTAVDLSLFQPCRR